MKFARMVAAGMLAGVVVVPRLASAFCGFYVSPGDQKLVNNATNVVLMRSGTRTVLSIQNNYQGPPTEFAMVVPVPTVLQEGDVKTLAMDVFDHVDQMGAPRLVEYWEQDPCHPYRPEEPRLMMAPSPDRKMATGAMRDDDLGVKIEAKFKVGEYDIVILSAKDSTGLDTWLRQENYKIPAGAEPLLRPYVEGGMKFFVAKVDPAKVKFVDNRAALSPLRFFYDTDDFSLPIRLGLANSNGTQDLIVNILAQNQRYEVANYKNVTIPTNIDISEQMKDQFGSFYTALYDRTLEKNPGAVVTEYAWQATTCDPCPGPALGPEDFTTLGADVLGNNDPYGYGMVLTRLHARYGTDITQDLQFKAASPITGGREVRGPDGKLEERASAAGVNNFQGRYAIRHPWTGPLTCDKPVRGVWGGPPDGGSNRPQAAQDIAFAARGKVQLRTAVLQDVPEIDLKMGGPDTSAGSGSAEPAAVMPEFGGPGSASADVKPEKPGVLPTVKSGGCGCDVGDAGTRNGNAFGALLLGALWLVRRRK